jgi:hypothetical protein
MTPAQEQLNQQLWNEGKFEKYAAGIAKRADNYARVAEICFNRGDVFFGSACEAKARSLRETSNWRPA